MSAQATSFRRPTPPGLVDEFDIEDVHPTQSITETVELSEQSDRQSTSEQERPSSGSVTVQMRASSVRPITSGDEEKGAEQSMKDEKEPTDSSDGINPFSGEAFAPLLSTNQYTVRKMAAQALMDVALLMANISQLRTLLAGGTAMEHYTPLVVLVSISLGFQLIFAVLIFIIWMRESDFNQKQEYLSTLSQVIASNGKDTTTVTTSERIRISVLKREEAYKEHRCTNHLNYVTMVLVFFITVINMFITGFGIKLQTGPSTASLTSHA